MRIELSDGEMLELADYDARMLYETLLERARARGAISAAAKLRLALAWSSGAGTKVALEPTRDCSRAVSPRGQGERGERFEGGTSRRSWGCCRFGVRLAALALYLAPNAWISTSGGLRTSYPRLAGLIDACSTKKRNHPRDNVDRLLVGSSRGEAR